MDMPLSLEKHKPRPRDPLVTVDEWMGLAYMLHYAAPREEIAMQKIAVKRVLGRPSPGSTM
jgi:hypothetical protein